MVKSEVYRQVAALHASSIDQGFLATLGVPFLAFMYRAIDEAPGSVLLVETRNDHVAGFVSGGVGMGPVYRRMLQHPLRLGWALLPILFKPRAITRIFEILSYGRRKTEATSLPDAELLSIAVAPAARGCGIAESLYRQLAESFTKRGVTAFKITVGDALLPAHRFYARMGAIPVCKTEVHAGESSTVYLHDLAYPAEIALDAEMG